jgi:hypothetical protein
MRRLRAGRAGRCRHRWNGRERTARGKRITPALARVDAACTEASHYTLKRQRRSAARERGRRGRHGQQHIRLVVVRAVLKQALHAANARGHASALAVTGAPVTAESALTAPAVSIVEYDEAPSHVRHGVAKRAFSHRLSVADACWQGLAALRWRVKAPARPRPRCGSS